MMAERRKDSMAPTKPIELDDVLVNELGQFGRFQLTNILLVTIPIVMSAFTSDFIFSAAAIPHRCRIPECGENSKTELFDPNWLSGAIPMVNNRFASCQRFGTTGENGTLDSCPAMLFHQEETQNCANGFVYARDDSVVYDFDLGCQEWMRALAGTLRSVGTLLVQPITGYISDRWGRRAALLSNVLNMALFGLIRAFSVNYNMYLVLKLIQSALGGAVFSSAYVFAVESVGPKWRVLVGATLNSMYAVGLVVLGAIAWGVNEWRLLLMILYIPCFLVISYYWIMSESVRWLLSKEKFEEAKKVLEKIARANRTQISEHSMAPLMTSAKPTVHPSASDSGSMIKTILKSRILLRRVLTTPIWWISTTLVYNGLSINSTSLSDQMYLDFILTAAIEIPGAYSSVLLLDRIGRKPTLSGGFILSATCNIAFSFISTDMTVLRLLLYLLGKLGISLVFSVLYQYTSELYPTQHRHSLLAFSSMVGRIGAIAAPLTPVFMSYWTGLPTMLFGIMGLISGVLVLTQPETLGTKMPDTLAEAEALGSPESKFNIISDSQDL